MASIHSLSEAEADRLKRLRALAERGVGGEKENAQRILERLCDKYGLDISQLDTEEKKLTWFRYRKGNHFRKLLAQCIVKVCGKGTKLYGHNREATRAREYAVECTASEAVEIELDYEFYADALQKELDRLISMFIQKNNIFPKDVTVAEDCELTEEDILLYRSIKHQ